MNRIGYGLKLFIILTLFFVVNNPVVSEAGFWEWLCGDCDEKRAEFGRVLLDNTTDSYERFLKKYPHVDYAKGVKKIIHDFQKNIVIEPSEVPLDSTEFTDKVFFTKEEWNGIHFITANASPFFSDLPQRVSLPLSHRQREEVAVIIQEVKTSNTGRKRYSNSTFGGRLTRFFIIDNASDLNCDVFMDIYINAISSVVSVPAKSHFIIDLNLARFTRDILHIKVVRKGTNEIVEELTFPMIQGKSNYMGWYVYNVGKNNKYRVDKSIYKKE